MARDVPARDQEGEPAPASLGAAADVHGGRTAAVALSVLAALLPFEPRRPVVPVGAFEFTFLELAAGLVLGVLVVQCRRELAGLVRRPTAPLAFAAAFAGAHLLSAALAPSHRELALKFALRMAALAAFAWAVAAVPARGVRAALTALACGSAVVATLAILEARGLRGLDTLLAPFREMPFNVAGFRRGSAATEYPNLAAAYLLYGLQAMAGLSPTVRRPLWTAVPLGVLLSMGLLYTYSRGALLAAALGLTVLSAVLWSRDRALTRAPVATLGVLAVSSAVFAFGGEVFRLRLEHASTTSWYSAAYVPAVSSLRLRPGEFRTTEVRVTNTGRKTWTLAEQFHLSYQWFDPALKTVTEGARTRLPRDMASGDSILLRAEVQAPDRAGRYVLVWDMVHENTTWFSGQGVSPAQVSVIVEGEPVAVTPPPAVAADVPPPRPLTVTAQAPPSADVSWRPGRWELWRLAAKMWAERPLVGVGPDNFRWLYGPRSGHTYWDNRIFANNLFLEVAATTGAVGLVALCGMLATSARAAWIALRRATRTGDALCAAVLFSLVLTVAIHGMTDYLLESTGQYLVLGLAVGGAAAARRDAEGPP